ncbi:MAG: hypothetical protein K2Y37_08480 [Pirellulales bacterium]|nr:hypothetical protein [Pirellulales bacterium]
MKGETPFVEFDIPCDSANDPPTEDGSPLDRRFDVFLIDSGWNTAIGAAVKENLELVRQYLERQNLYILSAEQSRNILKTHPHYLGSDPIFLVVDRQAFSVRAKEGYGFRLNLGVMKDADSAIALLRWGMQIVCDQQTAQHVTQIVRRTARKEGVEGAIEIIAEATSTLAEGVII